MESRSSVLVARKVVERGDAPIRIVIGVDGSPSAEAVVKTVASRDWPHGTVALVVAVDETVRPTGIAVGLLPTGRSGSAKAMKYSGQERAR